MRALVCVLACALGCGSDRASEAPPIIAPASEIGLVDRWFAAMESQLATDAAGVAAATFTSEAEARDALTSLTPAAFQPRPEFFQPLFDEVPRAQLAQRLSAYAALHGDEMERRGAAMMRRLEPVMQRAFDSVQRQRSRW